MYLAGLDLAGKEKNKTAIAFYETSTRAFILKEAYKNEQIIKILEKFNPKVIAIDAPLTFPLSNKAFREAEKQLITKGFRPLPLNMPSMEILVKRAIKLKAHIFSNLKEVEIIECFASASLKVLYLNKLELEKKLKRKLDKDDVDALACALTAYFYKKGNYEILGKKEEGTIILPKIL